MEESKMCLYFQGWHVATYPFSYSIRDCLEHWCETIGWEFLGCKGLYDILHCNVPEDYLTMDVIYHYSDRQNRVVL